jgi:hypothetical protein
MQGADAVILWRMVELGLVLVPWRRTRINALLRALHRVSVPSGKHLATVLSDVPSDRYARYLRGQVM